MLRIAAERTPGLLAEPRPFVLQKALGDFCVTYEINAYCDQPQAMARIYTALHQNILDLFNEYGVQIMTPAYEGDTEQPKVVPKENWFAAPAEPASTVQGGRAATVRRQNKFVGLVDSPGIARAVTKCMLNIRIGWSRI